MKRFSWIVALLGACAIARAETLAVFGKNRIAVVQPGQAVAAIPDDGAEQNFLWAFEAWAKAPSFDDTVPLDHPPEWGKIVPRSSGQLRYQRTFKHGFVAHLAVEGLAPHHVYLLTLNGTPHHPGNELLLDPVPGIADERFYDFLRVRTNDRGAWTSDLGIFLKPGLYHVRVYVKDTDDFKIVLYRDFFDFTVAPGASN